MASVLIVGVGITLGVLGGIRGGLLDKGMLVTTVIGQAVPSFVAAIVLIWLFAVRLSWFPAIGPVRGSPAASTISPCPRWRWRRLSRLRRADLQGRDPRRAGPRARPDRSGLGLSSSQVVRRHVVRNAMIPIATVSGLTIAGLLAGTVVVERAFNLDGLGSLLVEAVVRKDVAVVQAVSLILVAAFVVVNTLVDSSTGCSTRVWTSQRDHERRRSQPRRGRVDRQAPGVVEARRRLGPLGLAALAAIGGLGLLALLAPVLPVADPTDVDLTSTFAPPSAGHPLGTDSNGRDILARLVWGSRTALLGPLIVTVVATAVGPAGRCGGVAGGWFDGVISRVFDLLFGFPGILLALVVAAVVGAGFGAAVAALSVAFIPYIGRVTRGGALQQLRLPYVAALRVLGQSPAAICGRHLLPNLGVIIVAQATVTFGYALVDLAALSYLGLGVDQATPDWGGIVAPARPTSSAATQQSLYAGVLIVIAVAAFAIVAERLAGRERTWRRLR